MKTAIPSPAVSRLLSDDALHNLLARTQVMLINIELAGDGPLTSNQRDSLGSLRKKMAAREEAIVAAINCRADRPRGEFR